MGRVFEGFRALGRRRVFCRVVLFGKGGDGFGRKGRAVVFGGGGSRCVGFVTGCGSRFAGSWVFGKVRVDI